MMKKLIYSILLTCLFGLAQAQSIDDDFFEKVSYVGAFGDEDWTESWTNWDPNATEYGTPADTLGNGDKSLVGGLKITDTQEISGIVLLDGWVYVQDGGQLNIAAGTVIRGTEGACLVIERGGKIMAEGTAQDPIVFTSINAPGERGPNDWAGVILLGKATNNKGTDVVIEGGTGATYGAGTGAVENDNSGVMKYVRIEFPGYDVDGNGNEINGLTMGSVGSGTTIDYVQVSYSGDDGYEWFGGTVNCKHLIAFGTEDDDFDTDYGFRGMLQFILAVRDPYVSETNDDSRGFESDNDGNSSYNNPRTSAIFSNVSLFGPVTDLSANQRHAFGFYLRRNTRLRIYNSLVTGYVKGQLRIDGNSTQAAASSDSLIINNTILGIDGVKPVVSVPSGQTWTQDSIVNWFMDPAKKNDTIDNASLGLNLPLTITDPDFIPQSGSLLLTGSTWYVAVTSVNITSTDTLIDARAETIQMTAEVLPAEASQDVLWSVEPAGIASVTANGILSALANGRVMVKVTSKTDSEKSATKYVTVSLPATANTIDDDFFTKVNYIGAFGDEDWTESWANWDPNSTEYGTPTTTLGNGDKSLIGGVKITGTQDISGIVLLDGWVYVQDGGQLNIAPGTVIRGSEGACLVIERGGKIMAEGTAQNPIVFTSNNAVGERGPNDWAGVIILGKATNNKGTDVVIEGGTGATYGAGTGALENDNSGVFKYVRIEFPGYDVDGNGNEINGLTMGSVGSGTTIDYVQVSFSGDDGYEWFGGTVNCRHLIAYGTEDDDFDTDYGFRGLLQFILAVRDPYVSETNDDSRGFESDNDGNSSYNNPRTSAIFSNVSLFGPVTDESANQRHAFGFYLRRNTRLRIYNSLVTGYVKGQLRIDGNSTQAAASSDSLIINNTILGVDGVKPVVSVPDGQTWSHADIVSWFMDPAKKNDTIDNASLGLNLPLTITDPDFIPQSGSPLLIGSTWYVYATSVDITSADTLITSLTETIQMTAEVVPALSSQTVTWSVEPAGIASIAEDGVLSPIADGRVLVTATATDGSEVSGSIYVTVSLPNALNTETTRSISIYPNPVDQVLTISNTNSNIDLVEIFTLTGQPVLTVNNPGSKDLTLDISSLNSGLYVIRIATDDSNIQIFRISKR